VGQFPNPDTQFKPGWAGGPGRPRKRPLTDLLAEKLGQDSGDGTTWDERIVTAWVEAAAAGDVAALKELLNRIEGKVPDKLVTSDRSVVVQRKDRQATALPAPSDDGS
jgi:hypothetical protein